MCIVFETHCMFMFTQKIPNHKNLLRLVSFAFKFNKSNCKFRKTMSEEYEEKDVYVLLDFQGKDTSKYFKQQSVYFRMLNLNENKPIVEIEDDVFEGIYDDAIGTNVYFEEVEDPPPNVDIFEGATPITLQYLVKQNKILKMKKIGTKPKPVIDAGPTETVNIHIQEDYRLLLEKFQNDKLNIEECITVDDVEETNSESEHSVEISDDTEEDDDSTEPNSQWESSRLPHRQNLKPEWFTAVIGGPSDETQMKSSQKPTNPTYIKYEKLQKLAEQPSRRKILPEIVENNKIEQPLHGLPTTDFILWKNLIMQSVEQQSVNLDVNKDNIEDFVDIEKSIEAGIIAPSNQNPRIFIKEEKQELLSFKNFINVSPLMKLIMLQDFIHLEKVSMRQMTQDELNEVGSDGCTPIKRLQLLKNFKVELETHIISRVQDAREYDETLEKLEDFKLDLSDDEETSETDFSSSSDNYDEDIEEQPSDSKGEDEGMSTDVSESEQHEVVEEISSNLSDGEANSTTNIKQENKDAT